jgi:hypothetical protein
VTANISQQALQSGNGEGPATTKMSSSFAPAADSTNWWGEPPYYPSQE